MNIPHYVYILEITSNNTVYNKLYKIGCSNDVRKRISSLTNTERVSSQARGKGIIIHNIILLAIATFADKATAYKFEKSTHNLYRKFQYKGCPILPNGNSELFISNIAQQELRFRTSLFKRIP